jgi:hypothetical protein
MRKPARLSIGVAAAGVAAVAVLGTTTAAIAHTAAKPANQQERFSLLSTKPNATPTLLATGPAHAIGKLVTVNSKSEKLVFPDGTITVAHKRVGQPKTSFDPKTCLHTYTEHGLWQATKMTGRYHGSLGVGSYTVNVRQVQCGKSSPVKVYMSDTEFTGRITN